MSASKVVKPAFRVGASTTWKNGEMMENATVREDWQEEEREKMRNSKREKGKGEWSEEVGEKEKGRRE